MNTIIKAMNWRYATKTYNTSKKVSQADLDTILDGGLLAPSSFGLQPYKIILVENPETRKKLRDAAWGQTPITDASYLLVLAARTDVDDKYVDNFVNFIAKERGVTVDGLKGYSDMMKGSVTSKGGTVTDWAKMQAYIVLGTMLTIAAQIGVDSTPMEGFDAAQFDEILGLKKLNLTSAVVMAIGKRADDDVYSTLKKVRFPKSEMLIVE